ncbi:MAG: GspE/PulE family protein [Myxococcota bacterium]
MRLGDYLVSMGSVSRAVVEEAAAASAKAGKLLGETLVERNIVDERDLYRALATNHGLRFADADTLFGEMDPQVARAVPKAFRSHERIIPIAVSHGRVVAATTNPRAAHPELAQALGATGVDFTLVTPTDLRRLATGVDLNQLPRPSGASGASTDIKDMMRNEQDVSPELVALVDSLLLDAIAQRASDIHLEIYGSRVRVRFRVDGDLVDAARYRLTREQLAGVINVVKVTARLDIAERRLPQGGRCTVRAGDHVFDLRVQTQPALHGEHVVIRLLPHDARIPAVEDLGFPHDVAITYRRLLQTPAGMVLVVGPTGSGKSTTLYAGLQLLAQDASRKVITVEDPIEYAIDGIQQTEARPDIGFAFAHAMRAFVREDPDVILVGEIRDAETALEAIRASQTGHLVLSTLHCNDTVDAVQRLRDLGMHANSVAAELLAVFAQRLARRICTECKAPHTPSETLVREIFPGGQMPFPSFKGKGCARCHGTGAYGRIAAVEVLLAGPDVRRAISRQLPLDDLRSAALNAGLVPMREHALSLVQQGIIALEELPTMLPAERLRPGAPAPRRTTSRARRATDRAPKDAAPSRAPAPAPVPAEEVGLELEEAANSPGAL